VLGLLLALVACDSADDAAAPNTGGSLGSGGATTGGSGGATNSGGSNTGGSNGDSSLRGCAGRPATTLFCNDFNDDAVGVYTEATLKADWASPSWNDGVDEGRVSIFQGAEASEGRSLRVVYPKGSVGPGPGGAQWYLLLSQKYEELYLAYRVRFGSSFDFVKGGKLPGLVGTVGGKAPTGGNPADGTNGFSARGMWRSGGAAVQYVYYWDQKSNYGDDLAWNAGGAKSFVPGQWHTVEHRVKLNTEGQANGIIEAWLDGVQVLSREDLRIRKDAAAFGIDALYFSTFFGGNDASWAPTKDETVEYDDFVVATAPITH
jgi:hypothetical protein